MAMTIAFILKREGETVLKPFFKIALPTIDLTLNSEQDKEKGHDIELNFSEFIYSWLWNQAVVI
jgi:hypothetical protein